MRDFLRNEAFPTVVLLLAIVVGTIGVVRSMQNPSIGQLDTPARPQYRPFTYSDVGNGYFQIEAKGYRTIACKYSTINAEVAYERGVDTDAATLELHGAGSSFFRIDCKDMDQALELLKFIRTGPHDK